MADPFRCLQLILLFFVSTSMIPLAASAEGQAPAPAAPADSSLIAAFLSQSENTGIAILLNQLKHRLALDQKN